MKITRNRTILVATMLAVAAMMVLAGAAFAQSDLAGRGPGWGGRTGATYEVGMRGAWAGPSNSLTAVAADVLGMERVDLVAELAEGISIADAAQNHGIDAQDITDAYLAGKADSLAQLVADGRISQEQADLMLAQMQEQVEAQIDQPWSPRGFGTGDGTGVPGQGMGSGWVDEDGDGVCDLFPGTFQGQRGSHAFGGRGGRWNW